MIRGGKERRPRVYNYIPYKLTTLSFYENVIDTFRTTAVEGMPHAILRGAEKRVHDRQV